MIKQFSIENSGVNIKCLGFFKENQSVNSVVIACHGFAGHKESAATEKFSNCLLKKNPHCAVIALDLPGHGEDGETRLSLDNCERYITELVSYIKTEYPNADIFYYGVSFGGFLGLYCLSKYGIEPLRKIALRCPAVNITHTFRNKLMGSGEKEQLEKNGYVYLGFDVKVKVDREFLAELDETQISEKDFSPFSDDIIIIQGTDDELLDFGVIKAFAEKNNIKFIGSENTDHRFLDDNKLFAAIDKIIGFFEL